MNDFQKKQDEHREWLDSLKPGDTVAITRYSRFGGGRWFFETVVLRRTKTLIMTEGQYSGECRFRADSGLEQGRRYGGMELVPMTDDVRTQMRAAANRQRFANITHNHRNLNDTQIAAMLEAYDRVTEADKAA